MLTIKQLEEMKPEERFATGTGQYDELHHGQIRWVAVRGGGYHDWCIYYHLESESVEDVARHGDKIFTKLIIERLVPCDDESYNIYRR